MKRTTLSVYEDTRELLDQIKRDYDFKSDDHAIKFMSSQFIGSQFAKNLKEFQEYKNKNKEQ